MYLNIQSEAAATNNAYRWGQIVVSTSWLRLIHIYLHHDQQVNHEIILFCDHITWKVHRNFDFYWTNNSVLKWLALRFYLNKKV